MHTWACSSWSFAWNWHCASFLSRIFLTVVSGQIAYRCDALSSISLLLLLHLERSSRPNWHWKFFKWAHQSFVRLENFADKLCSFFVMSSWNLREQDESWSSAENKELQFGIDTCWLSFISEIVFYSVYCCSIFRDIREPHDTILLH